MKKTMRTDEEKKQILQTINEATKGGMTLKKACEGAGIYTSQHRTWNRIFTKQNRPKRIRRGQRIAKVEIPLNETPKPDTMTLSWQDHSKLCIVTTLGEALAMIRGA